MPIVFCDIETYSDVDLTKVGAPVYAAHPSTEILMVAWAVDGGDVQFHDFTADPAIPKELQDLFGDDGAIFRSWNAAFETTLLREKLGVDLPLTRWRCSMVHAMSLALPGSLAQAGQAVDLDDKYLKNTEGKRLIRLFSMPRKATKAKPYTRAARDTDPEDWALFCEYNRQDVEAERAIYRRIRKWTMQGEEWAHWRLDRKINDTGFPIDRVLVDAAIIYRPGHLRRDGK